MFFEPQIDQSKGSPPATCELSFEGYFEALQSFFKRLGSGATFPNVLLPTECLSPLREMVITLQPSNVVSSYAHLFGRLPGSVVVLPQTVSDFIDQASFETYFENWFKPIYDYCPKIRVLADKELLSYLAQGNIELEGRYFDLICYYPVDSQNFLLGNKSCLRRLLENSPVKECAEILVPGEICARADLAATLEKAFRKWNKLVVQVPMGAGGFGTWVVENGNEGYIVNQELHPNLGAVIEKIQAQVDESSEFIVMQYIKHTPVSVGAVLSEDGYYILGPFRRQLIEGASYKGIYFEPNQPQGANTLLQDLGSFLEDYCKNLPRGQNLTPVIGFDFLLAHEPQGKLFITECNPRQTGALPLEMLLTSVRRENKPLYTILSSGLLSAFQLDHCKVPGDWVKNFELFEKEFPRTINERFGLDIVFLPTVARESGREKAVEKVLSTSSTILVAPATPPNPSGVIALQFVAPPKLLQDFFSKLTNGGEDLTIDFQRPDSRL